MTPTLPVQSGRARRAATIASSPGLLKNAGELMAGVTISTASDP